MKPQKPELCQCREQGPELRGPPTAFFQSFHCVRPSLCPYSNYRIWLGTASTIFFIQGIKRLYFIIRHFPWELT